MSCVDGPGGGGGEFGETRAHLEKAISDAVREIETLADDEAAYRQASWLTETLRSATNSTAALRLAIVRRIQESGQLSLAHLGSRIGVSKARAAEMMQAARRKGKP